MSGVENTREDLAHLWKARVENVKLHLDFATQYLKEVGEDHRSGRIPSTSSDARENAIRAYLEAVAEYVNISRIYRDLVLRGKIPEARH
jgi:hypothetical protein